MNKVIYAKKNQLLMRLMFGCLIMALALTLPIYFIQQNPIFERPQYNHLIKSLAVGSIVLLGIWLLRLKFNGGTLKEIGLSKPKTALKHFLIGIGLVGLPLLLTIILSDLFNWVEYKINTDWTIILTFFIGLISTFFTDALSEELIFRGYIFSNLKEHYSIWKSSVITLILFVLAPIIILSIQNSLNIQVGVSLTGGYIITLLIFGAFMQYLRVLFGSIWIGVGFHMIFVHMNSLMGTTSDRFLQFSENTNEKPVQILLICLLVISFLSLIIFPLVKRKQNKKTLKTS